MIIMEKTAEQVKSNSIYIGIGDLTMTSAPELLVSLGLGSCIALTIYAPKRKIAVMAHIMLPDSPDPREGKIYKIGKFADKAIPEMVRMFDEHGIKRRELRAKFAGGAKMFAFSSSPAMAIGEKNISRVKELLKKFSVTTENSDTGGTKGRSVTFYTDTCELEVRIVGRKPKIL